MSPQGWPAPARSPGLGSGSRAARALQRAAPASAAGCKPRWQPGETTAPPPAPSILPRPFPAAPAGVRGAPPWPDLWLQHGQSSTQLNPNFSGRCRHRAPWQRWLGLPNCSFQFPAAPAFPLFRTESLRSFLLPFAFILSMGSKWMFLILPSRPTGRTFPFFFFFVPALNSFIQINLWAEAKPWEISSKRMKFSEPNGSNYREFESKLFGNFNKSRL